MAAEAFLEGDDGCEIIMEKKEVRLSKILQWYKEDFGSNQTEVRVTHTPTVVQGGLR